MESSDEKMYWNSYGSMETKRKDDQEPVRFILKQIHQVTSRHQKIRVDENRVGGTCFVRYLCILSLPSWTKQIKNVKASTSILNFEIFKPRFCPFYRRCGSMDSRIAEFHATLIHSIRV